MKSDYAFKQSYLFGVYQSNFGLNNLNISLYLKYSDW